MTERAFTTSQVAALLGLSPAAVVDWMQKGLLSFHRLPNGPVRIPEKSLVQFLRSQGIDLQAILAKVIVEESRGVAAGAALEEPAHSSAWRPARSIAPLPPAPDADTIPQTRMLESLQPAAIDQPQQQDAAVLPPDESASAPAHQPPASDSVLQQADQQTADRSAPHEPGVGVGDPVAQVAMAICRDALIRGAQAIHFEPRGDGLALRLRIGDVMQDKDNFHTRLPANVASHLLKHYRQLAQMPLHGSVPQHGSFTLSLEGTSSRFEVATCPMRHGEKMVLHVHLAAASPDLSQLGLAGADAETIGSLLDAPGGMIVVAAPPGHGREFLLRAMLRQASSAGRSMLAFDPQNDMPIDGVNEMSGLTRGDALVAAAGMDADLVLLDEIDSAAVAMSAVETAAGGALVLAGMNAPDAARGMSILMEANSPRWSLAASLLAVLSVRRLRRLCTQCKSQSPASEAAMDCLRLDSEARKRFASAPKAVGCAKCGHGGYDGTMMLLQVARIGTAAGRLLRGGDVSAALAQSGMNQLLDAGLDRVRAGTTTLEEVARALRGL